VALQAGGDERFDFVSARTAKNFHRGAAALHESLALIEDTIDAIALGSVKDASKAYEAALARAHDAERLIGSSVRNLEEEADFLARNPVTAKFDAEVRKTNKAQVVFAIGGTEDKGVADVTSAAQVGGVLAITNVRLTLSRQSKETARKYVVALENSATDLRLGKLMYGSQAWPELLNTARAMIANVDALSRACAAAQVITFSARDRAK